MSLLKGRNLLAFAALIICAQSQSYGPREIVGSIQNALSNYDISENFNVDAAIDFIEGLRLDSETNEAVKTYIEENVLPKLFGEDDVKVVNTRVRRNANGMNAADIDLNVQGMELGVGASWDVTSDKRKGNVKWAASLSKNGQEVPLVDSQVTWTSPKSLKLVSNLNGDYVKAKLNGQSAKEWLKTVDPSTQVLKNRWLEIEKEGPVITAKAFSERLGGQYELTVNMRDGSYKLVTPKGEDSDNVRNINFKAKLLEKLPIEIWSNKVADINSSGGPMKGKNFGFALRSKEIGNYKLNATGYYRANMENKDAAVQWEGRLDANKGKWVESTGSANIAKRGKQGSKISITTNSDRLGFKTFESSTDMDRNAGTRTSKVAVDGQGVYFSDMKKVGSKQSGDWRIQCSTCKGGELIMSIEMDTSNRKSIEASITTNQPGWEKASANIALKLPMVSITVMVKDKKVISLLFDISMAKPGKLAVNFDHNGQAQKVLAELRPNPSEPKLMVKASGPLMDLKGRGRISALDKGLRFPFIIKLEGKGRNKAAGRDIDLKLDASLSPTETKITAANNAKGRTHVLDYKRNGKSYDLKVTSPFIGGHVELKRTKTADGMDRSLTLEKKGVMYKADLSLSPNKGDISLKKRASTGAAVKTLAELSYEKSYSPKLVFKLTASGPAKANIDLNLNGKKSADIMIDWPGRIEAKFQAANGKIQPAKLTLISKRRNKAITILGEREENNAVTGGPAAVVTLEVFDANMNNGKMITKIQTNAHYRLVREVSGPIAFRWENPSNGKFLYYKRDGKMVNIETRNNKLSFELQPGADEMVLNLKNDSSEGKDFNKKLRVKYDRGQGNGFFRAIVVA